MLTKQDEIVFQAFSGFKRPKPYLEQYQTPPGVAVRFLNMAAKDIYNKVVVDLGCGTGILSIGSAIIGAKLTVGVDIDVSALKVAKRNLVLARSIYGNLNVVFVNADIGRFGFRCDTVVMNPPFGMQRKGQDKIFLESALKGAEVIWTLLGINSDPFVERVCRKFGYGYERVDDLEFPLKPSMKFHRKKVYRTKVSVYRIFYPVEN